MENGADYFIISKTWLNSDYPNGSSSKTSLGFSVAKTGKISEPSSKRWMSSGMVWRGEYWMQDSSEHPNVVAESSLSQVISLDAPLRYFLTISELQSLLQRAEDKNRILPTDLETAIKEQISILSKMPLLEECIHQARKGLDTDAMDKLGPLIQEEEVMLYVRRLTPSEYEELQGFQQGWTLLDI